MCLSQADWKCLDQATPGGGGVPSAAQNRWASPGLEDRRSNVSTQFSAPWVYGLSTFGVWTSLAGKKLENFGQSENLLIQPSPTVAWSAVIAQLAPFESKWLSPLWKPQKVRPSDLLLGGRAPQVRRGASRLPFCLGFSSNKYFSKPLKSSICFFWVLHFKQIGCPLQGYSVPIVQGITKGMRPQNRLPDSCPVHLQDGGLQQFYMRCGD